MTEASISGLISAAQRRLMQHEQYRDLSDDGSIVIKLNGSVVPRAQVMSPFEARTAEDQTLIRALERLLPFRGL